MLHMFREAGFAAYAVVAFGVLSLRWAWIFARTRESEHGFRCLVLAGLTLAFGILGTVAGLQASVQYISETPDKWLFLIGLREALHNLAFATAFLIADLAMLLMVPRRGSAQPLTAVQTVAPR